MKLKKNKVAVARLMTLSEIFEGRLFSIPDYQRGYAWDKEQVVALHEDIEQLFDTEHLHFTGTIVLTRNRHDQRNVKGIAGDVYDIIDGQQRLTTVFIILRELIGLLEGGQKDTLYELFIGRGDEGNATSVFKLNSQIEPYFYGHVIQGHIEPKSIEYFSEQRIAMSKKASKKWIRSMIEGQGKTVEELISVITGQLGFILYQPENNAEAGMMFEVINNRGKALNELEKVKNYLIYYAIKQNKSELRLTIDQSWGEILKNLASAHRLTHPDENTFLRAVSVVFLGLNKTQASNIYHELKKTYPVGGDIEDWKQLKAFVEFMRNCSFYYDALLNENSDFRRKLDEDVRIYLELIRSQTSYANILPAYFAVMDNRDNLIKQHFIDILRMMELFNFRVYMAKNGVGRTDTGQGPLYSMAYGFHTSFESGQWLNYWRGEDEFNYKDNVSLLISKLVQLVDEYNPDKAFRSGLILGREDHEDFFDWHGLRYFLMNYEREIKSKRVVKVENILQQRKPKKSNEYLSVEHIWAQANEAGRKPGSTDSSYEKRRLGNFVLLELGINIQAQDEDIDRKVAIYTGDNSDSETSELKQVHLLIKDYKKVKKELDEQYERKGSGYRVQMHKGVINRNQERLTKFAIKRWSMSWCKNYLVEDEQ